MGSPAGETGSEGVEALSQEERAERANQADRTEDTQDSSWEKELVARCLAGDEEAFARIVDTYGGLLLRTAYLLIKDEEGAKDLVQETFFLAWKNMATLRDPALLRSWLLKILVNQAISLKRQLARQATLLRERLAGEEQEQLLPKTSLREGRVEDWLDVVAALQRLPVKQRVVLVLFYYHRLTMPEIAAMLGVAENTLRKRLQLALKKMRRLLQIRSQEWPAAQEETVGADQPPSQIASGREEQHE
ncbi:MAG: RNA polymerase sigma factor [Thermogemmatispora sp.]|uniref:RNA polymerase sigma factor n=1 Tax=Thermogemmatispora sp. TaxID=1968838 RepID=UPI00261313CD|nr:RNA polymerase sigma factor [Thermogemmatispora sp.]MBX5458497.1 RNA polymerase sigma factor [Thermogemmatispora sp.]